MDCPFLSLCHLVRKKKEKKRLKKNKGKNIVEGLEREGAKLYLELALKSNNDNKISTRTMLIWHLNPTAT